MLATLTLIVLSFTHYVKLSINMSLHPARSDSLGGTQTTSVSFSHLTRCSELAERTVLDLLCVNRSFGCNKLQDSLAPCGSMYSKTSHTRLLGLSNVNKTPRSYIIVAADGFRC